MTATDERTAATTDTRGRSRLANDSWESLMSAYAAMHRRLGADAPFSSVSVHEYDVLYTMSKCPGPARTSEVGRNVKLSQPALSRLVDRLVERGLVERSTCEADRRIVELTLTDAGRELQRAEGGPYGVRIARLVASALTTEEMRQLEELTGRLANAAREDA